MIVVGIDLSGPANSLDTALVMFASEGPKLTCRDVAVDLDDQKLLNRVSNATDDSPVIVGLDAPLSYNTGGGDRPGDKALRTRVIGAGLATGSVMPPTMTRMAYLTLRGVCVARALETIRPVPPRLVEVHPVASMALRHAPLADVKAMKRSAGSRLRLLEWLESQGLQGVAASADVADHVVAACACALAAWKWASEDVAWCRRAEPPLHPYDFAC